MIGERPYPEKKAPKHLRAELIALIDFFKSLRGPVRDRLQSEALARTLDGQATLNDASRPSSTSAWLRETVFDNPRRITARVATRRLHTLLDAITSSLAYLTDQELRATPLPEDLIEIVVLSAAAIDHLVGFLYLGPIMRVWPDPHLDSDIL